MKKLLAILLTFVAIQSLAQKPKQYYDNKKGVFTADTLYLPNSNTAHILYNDSLGKVSTTRILTHRVAGEWRVGIGSPGFVSATFEVYGNADTLLRVNSGGVNMFSILNDGTLYWGKDAGTGINMVYRDDTEYLQLAEFAPSDVTLKSQMITMTASGDGSDQTIELTLPLGSSFAMIGPGSGDAAGFSHWTMASNIVTIHYATAPPNGTNNLSYWIIYK